MSSNKKTKLKGSVLYTVVAVMTILTIFVFSAIALAASANRRAHNNYANNQTQFTARSVVDLVWDTIQKDSSLRNKVNTLNKDGTLNISVEGLDNSMGDISQAYIKCIDNVSGNKSYKLTVTAEMLGHENTVSAYYAVNPTVTRPLFEYGLRAYQECSLDNVIVFGGTCTGVDYLESSSSPTNLTVISNGNSMYNSPMHIKGDCRVDRAESINLNQKSGMVVQGDIELSNSENPVGGNIIPNLPYRSNKYMDLPYIYSYMHYYGNYGGGKIKYNNSRMVVGSKETPILVIAQNMECLADADQSIYGDLYLLGRDRTSVINKHGVQKFNGSVVDIEGLDSYTGGNIYSLGTVEYNINGSATVNETANGIANNIIADKINFKYGGNGDTIETSGAVVANELGINGISNFNFAKGLFVPPENIKIYHVDWATGAENFGDLGVGTSSAVNGITYGKRSKEVQYIQRSRVKEGSVINVPIADNDPLNRFWNLSDFSYTYYNPDTWQWINKSTRHETHRFYIDYHDFSDFPDDADGLIVKPTSVTINWKKSVNFTYGENNSKISELGFDCTFNGKRVSDNADETYLSFNRFNFYPNTFNDNPSAGAVSVNINQEKYFNDYNENYLEFKLSNMGTNYINGSEIPYDRRQIEATSITLTADFYVDEEKTRTDTVDYEETPISYLEAVNNVAFDNNGGVIKIDDADKSVRIERIADTSGNYKYIIKRALLRDENGNERSVNESDYKVIAYNESGRDYYYITNEDTNKKDKVICGIDGNLLYKQGVVDDGTKYNIGEPGWIYEFTADNYDKFMRAVNLTVTFPESLGMKYLRSGVKQYEINKSEIQSPYPDSGDISITEYEDGKKEITGIMHIRPQEGLYPDTSDGNILAVDIAGNITLNTADGNKVGYEENNALKMVRYEEDSAGIKSVTVYRDLYIRNWSAGGIIEQSKCKIKYSNLKKASGTDKVMLNIGGVEYTCDDPDNDADRPEDNVKVYKILIDKYGREALNGITNGLKTNSDQSACKLIDDRYLQGIWGIRSNGLRDVVDSVDKMFVVDDNLNKPIVKTENLIYDLNNEKIIRKEGTPEESIEDMPDPLIITESCTLRGTAKRDIQIITSNNNDINIKLLSGATYLDTEQFVLNRERTIIVDDDNGRVNFLLPYKKGGKITLKGKILTKHYQEILSAEGDKNIYANPVVDDRESDCQYVAEDKIPDIYFYSEYFKKKKEFYSEEELAAMSNEQKAENIREENGTLISRSDMQIDTGLGSIICGYFMLASAKLNADASGDSSNYDKYTYYFDDVPMKKDGGTVNPADNVTTMYIGQNTGSGHEASSGIIIGAVSCTQAGLNNYAMIAYVNPNPRDRDGNLFSNDVPKLQYYQAY